MARFPVLAVLAALAASAPAVAQDAADEVLAERRLRGCLMSGSAAAPRAGLLNAVAAVRALCRPQIERVREDRLREVDAKFGSPDTPLSDSRRSERDKARLAASILLNDEIVVAVSNFTGLTQ